MAKLISDTQTALAYRLGETSAPSTTNELSRRLSFFYDAIDQIVSERNWWFLRKLYATPTVTSKRRYTVPSDYRKSIQLRVNDIKYDEIPLREDYEMNSGIKNSVVNLANFDVATLSGWNFYVLGSEIFISPTESTPTALAITSITSSSTTATVTTTANHGLSDGQYVTISGANETAYNGSFQIIVTSETTFTYTCASTPSATPATGTITYVRNNLELWYFYEPTMPTSSASGIVIPDKFMSALVAYGEGRYWSMAHKRGKSADAFSEYENWLQKMRAEDSRQGFLAI